jgi:protein SDA1
MEVKGSKKTKSKEARLEKERKKHEKKLRKKAQRENTKNFFPIDQIYNPQDFCEKLFSQLKKFSGKFEVKLAMLSVISRMMGRHNLLIMNFYSYLLKYLTPH